MTRRRREAVRTAASAVEACGMRSILVELLLLRTPPIPGEASVLIQRPGSADEREREGGRPDPARVGGSCI